MHGNVIYKNYLSQKLFFGDMIMCTAFPEKTTISLLDW